MIVTNSFEVEKILNRKSAVALGQFDALHIGHMRIIRETVKYARQNNCIAIVQIFEMSEEGNGCINTLKQRIDLLEKAGVDIVVVEKFDDKFKKTKYQDFVFKYLNQFYKAEAVFVGFNYRFGHRAEGDAEKLLDECQKYGIRVFVQPSISMNGIVSSTRIRKLLAEGNVKSAAIIMGRRFSVSGAVIEGKAIGREMGFPTANMKMLKNYGVLKQGVYSVIVEVDNRKYRGITNVGEKPTVCDCSRNIETHIIGYDGNLYGKEITLEFYKRLRDVIKFRDIDELKKQLEKDKGSVIMQRKRISLKKNKS